VVPRIHLTFFLCLFYSEASKIWSYEAGAYMPRWMTYQVFIPLALLQLLNMFWYRLMLRILFRYRILSHSQPSFADCYSGLSSPTLLEMKDQMTKMKVTMTRKISIRLQHLLVSCIVLVIRDPLMFGCPSYTSTSSATYASRAFG
jgi:hypothetical protein